MEAGDCTKRELLLHLNLHHRRASVVARTWVVVVGIRKVAEVRRIRLEEGNIRRPDLEGVDTIVADTEVLHHRNLCSTLFWVGYGVFGRACLGVVVRCLYYGTM